MRDTRRILLRAVSVGAVGVLLSLSTAACSSAKSESVTASASATSAKALCQAVLAPADLPAGFSTTPMAPSDCSDPNHVTIDYGTDNSLQAVFEDLTLSADSEHAAANFSSYVSGNLAILLNVAKADASTYSDLGDQVSYYAGNVQDTYWNYLFIRRGRLLMTVGVTSSGVFTASQMHTLVQRAEALAQQFE